MKNKGFTILEMTVAILIFLIGIAVISGLYINLVKQYLISQNLQASLGNVKLALEKIWREMKYGINFATTTNGIRYKRLNDCANVEIKYNIATKAILYNSSTLIDPNYFEVNNFTIYATGSFGSQGDYNVTSFKLITISLSGIAKAKSMDIPVNFQISVAPINSVFASTSCGF
ncbi:MAG: PilW family protein [Minisyncoccia bacterium]|jgi:prepilin-type N-terminal cleavage/methylation domain-containing protein